MVDFDLVVVVKVLSPRNETMFVLWMWADSWLVKRCEVFLVFDCRAPRHPGALHRCYCCFHLFCSILFCLCGDGDNFVKSALV